MKLNFSLIKTKAFWWCLFLCGGAVNLAFVISGDRLDLVSPPPEPVPSYHSEAFVRFASTATAEELSRTGWAEEVGFHLCDASKKGMNYQDGLAYAQRSSLQIKKAMKYPEELRLKAFALAAKRFCNLD